jgi:hypothetical protein
MTQAPMMIRSFGFSSTFKDMPLSPLAPPKRSQFRGANRDRMVADVVPGDSSAILSQCS